MNRLFRTTVVETSGVRTIAGGGTNASSAGQAILNLSGVSLTGNQTISGVKTFRNLKIGPTTSVLDQTVDINYYNNKWRLVSNNTANSEIIESALVRGSGLPGSVDPFWAWRFNTDTNFNYDDGVLQLNNADAYDDGGYPNTFKYFDISVLGSGYNQYFYLDSQSGVMRLTRRPTVNATGVLLSGEAVNPLVSINNITGNFMFDKIHNGKVLYVSGNTDITGSLPALGLGLNVFSEGYNVSVVQFGSGNVIFNNGGVNGAYFRNRLNLNKTAGKYAIASILRLDQDEFLLYGDLV